MNSSGTLAEEIGDLEELNALVAAHEDELIPCGLTPELIQKGKDLAAEASGHDLVGILGLRDRENALLLRNRILNYALWLSREARATRRRFESHSFRNALRRLRPKRRVGDWMITEEPPTPNPGPHSPD